MVEKSSCEHDKVKAEDCRRYIEFAKRELDKENQRKILTLKKKLEDARTGNFGKGHLILDKDWTHIFAKFTEM